MNVPLCNMSVALKGAPRVKLAYRGAELIGLTPDILQQGIERTRLTPVFMSHVTWPAILNVQVHICR